MKIKYVFLHVQPRISKYVSLHLEVIRDFNQQLHKNLKLLHQMLCVGLYEY